MLNNDMVQGDRGSHRVKKPWSRSANTELNYHVGTPLKATGDCHQWVMESWHRNSLT